LRIPILEWKGNGLQFKFLCLDGFECAVGIIEWYLFPIPVWMYKLWNWFFLFEQYKIAYIYKLSQSFPSGAGPDHVPLSSTRNYEDREKKICKEMFL
jgi:hypothetical protein